MCATLRKLHVMVKRLINESAYAYFWGFVHKLFHRLMYKCNYVPTNCTQTPKYPKHSHTNSLVVFVAPHMKLCQIATLVKYLEKPLLFSLKHSSPKITTATRTMSFRTTCMSKSSFYNLIYFIGVCRTPMWFTGLFSEIQNLRRLNRNELVFKTSHTWRRAFEALCQLFV